MQFIERPVVSRLKIYTGCDIYGELKQKGNGYNCFDMKTDEMKTYILKREVHNSIDFPVGTLVKITDDYWGKNNTDKNTGFTVVKGKLKGKKGCVADGLQGWLVEDTPENRIFIKKCIEQERLLVKQMMRNSNHLEEMSPAKLTR